MHPRNTTQHKTQEDRSMRHGFTRCGYPLLPLTSHIRAAVCRPPMRWLQLYFPISFSLFKGKSVQVVHENGDWRTYGLGMVCISTTDFLASKGFSKTITGWGGCGVVSGYICPFAESPVNRSHTTRVFSRIECEWHTDFSTTAFVTACTATAAYSLCKLM
eukprot:m.888065 g.888065  ORF g.888065 m.888065 type:complete len:160 (-) comp23636_c0_seq60:1921-2400(-)